MESRNAFFKSQRKYAFECKAKSRTKQADKDGCDINNIVRRYVTKGILPEMIRQNPQYGDFSQIADYQQSLNLVMKAQEQFDALPAKLRAKFDNDPAKFLAFANDAKNIDQMVELGLATKTVKEDKQTTGGGQPHRGYCWW